MSIKESLLVTNKAKNTTTIKKKCDQGMTRSIIFLMIESRTDIAYTTSIISYFAKKFLDQYCKTIITIFCYFKATREIVITCERKQKRNLMNRGYYDSD